MLNLNKKLVFIIFIITIIILLVAVNQFIDNIYDLSLYEYLERSTPITEAETDYLINKGKFYFSSDINAPPFAYVDKFNNQYKGLILDYVNALSIELEIDIEFVPQKWENVISSVISNESDMCDIFPSEERRKNLLFSDPIYKLRAIVLTDGQKKDINSAKDLSGHIIAVPAGDYAVEYIKKNIQNVKIIETSDLLDSLTKLQEGLVDAVVGDEPVLLHFVNQLYMNDDVNILETELYEMEVCIGVNKSNYMLIHILNKGIFNLQKKNFVEKIQQKWFGISTPIIKHKVPERIMLFAIIMITSLILIFMFMVLWSYTLKSEVIKRTEELNKNRINLQMTLNSLSSFLISIDVDGFIINMNSSFGEYLKRKGIPLDIKQYKDIPILKNIDINDKLIQNRNEFIFEGKYYFFSISELEYIDCKYLIMIEDITDQKISQQQILQQNKMIALGQLAAGVAHEIRNPLGLILNYSYVLKTYILNKDSVAEEAIEVIENSALRVDKIVDNLLNFSHKDNNEPSFIFLKEAIKNIIYLERKVILSANVKVNVNCDDDLTFYCKAESLNHIILNLLSNSLDSMPDGGIINIDCKLNNESLMITFSDTGTGISQDNLEHIFNPFFTTKKVGQGTGLGLYIVYNEICKNNGEINVESHIGKGTSFTMKFPIIKEIC